MQGFQERGIRAKISLSACSNTKYFQRPSSSDLSKNAPSLQGISPADVARSRRRRVIPTCRQNLLSIWQWDKATIADLGHYRWLRLKVIDGKPNGRRDNVASRHDRRKQERIGFPAKKPVQAVSLRGSFSRPSFKNHG